MESLELTNLKTLVTTKIDLENEEKFNTPEYADNCNSINELLGSMSENTVKYLKNVCKQEYDNYLNFYNSDIAEAQREIMDKKMGVVIVCSDLLYGKPANYQPDMGLQK